MYIIGSETADDEIPKVTEEIKKFIGASGGIIEKHEELGKKKLAYPIKKSRMGYYVVVNFSAPAEKVNEIEHRIRTSQNVIRHLVLNMDEALVQMEKDRVVQTKLKAFARPKEEIPAEKEKIAKRPEKKFDIDLDAEIEKALGSDENIK